MTTVGDIVRRILGFKARLTLNDAAAAELVASVKGMPTRKAFAVMKARIGEKPRLTATPAVQEWAMRNSSKMAVLSVLMDKGKLPRR